MKNKLYYLSTCGTCKRIMKEVGQLDKFELIDIKTNNISARDLDFLKKQAGSYNALFSRRALKYRALGLHTRELSEAEIRELILGEYTFLKRPVFIYENNAYVGNTKKVVEEIKNAVNN